MGTKTVPCASQPSFPQPTSIRCARTETVWTLLAFSSKGRRESQGHSMDRKEGELSSLPEGQADAALVLSTSLSLPVRASGKPQP